MDVDVCFIKFIILVGSLESALGASSNLRVRFTHSFCLNSKLFIVSADLRGDPLHLIPFEPLQLMWVTLKYVCGSYLLSEIVARN